MQTQEKQRYVPGAHRSLSDQIHLRACEAASQHRKVEAELIEILQQVEQHRVFLARGYASLFLYVVKELGLSESVAYNLISVARKAREVPELKAEIARGTITLSNARKIVPVLNRGNKAEWLGKAAELSQRQLEKAVVKVRPQEATPERATYVTESRVKLELGLSEKDMLKLRRAQDLLCQSRKRAVTLEEVLVALTREFLHRNDPLERAKRQRVKTGLLKIESEVSTTALKSDVTCRNEENSSVAKVPHDACDTRCNQQDSQNAMKDKTEGLQTARPMEIIVQNPPKLVKAPVALQVERASIGAKREPRQTHGREPIHAKLLHQINLRDQRRCQFTNVRGEKCNQTRWIEVHHIAPVSKGGPNTLENLRTFCSAHHKWIHSHG